MPYTIGDRKIILDSNLSDSDLKLIKSHFKIFKYCLNNALHKWAINLKKLVHLYSDIMTIYSTLLRKIPNYDDITQMTTKNNLFILKLEDDLNEIFGKQIDSLNFDNWDDRNFELDLKPSLLLILDSVIETFDFIYSNLSCIELFFKNFNNLKKLLIPFLKEQTLSIEASLSKTKQILNVRTIVDHLDDKEKREGVELSDLRKIEKITSGIEKESIILKTAFLTFDASLKQYTGILLGKAILKRDILPDQCELVKRRDICFQAAEHVVSIPLTEEQTNNKTMKNLSKYLFYIIFGLVLLVSVVFYRIFKVIMCR